MKIAILKKDKESGVSYYRTAPVFDLCRSEGWHQLYTPPQFFTSDIALGYDILYCQRPGNQREMDALFIAKRTGVKVWYDIDDLLWNIPHSNEASLGAHPKNMSLHLQGMLNADLISCSTQALADEIEKEYDRRAIVIPNAWNSRYGEIMPFSKKPGKIRMLWRGSNTHAGDLYSHRSAFRQWDNIEFSTLGFYPWFFNVEYGGGIETLFHENGIEGITHYFNRLMEINPHFLVFPLEDKPFNRCKSNIAAIEATMSGGVCIAPAYMPEFKKFPCIVYQDVNDLKNILDAIDAGRVDMGEVAQIHRDASIYLREVLNLQKVNQGRKAIAEQLIKM